MSDEDLKPVEPVATGEELTEKAELTQESAPEGESKETPEQEDAESKAIKALQKRVDKLTRQKYEAQARADLLEEQTRSRQQPISQGLDRSQFASEEDYIDAVVEAKVQEREARKQQESKAGKITSILKEAEKLGDFDIADFKNVRISPIMAEAITDSDVAPLLVKHFHDDPEEAERISTLSPARQAVEIGKLEARLAEEKPAPTKSKAPPPIKAISAGNSSTPNYRPEMTFEQYAKFRGSRLPLNKR